jgi:hypothetical protein
MAGLSQYAQQKLIDHLTGKAAWTAPTAYVALLTTNPTTDAGASLVETTYTNYARVTTSAASWNSASGVSPSSATNAAALTFPTCGTTGATIVGFALYDASSAGNLMGYGTCSLAVSSGIAPQFAIGQLTVTAD